MLAIYAVGREGYDPQPFQRDLLAALVAEAVEPTLKSLERVICSRRPFRRPGSTRGHRSSGRRAQPTVLDGRVAHVLKALERHAFSTILHFRLSYLFYLNLPRRDVFVHVKNRRTKVRLRLSRLD